MQGYRCWLISLRKILWRLIDSSNSSIRNIFQKRVNMNYKNFRLLKFYFLYIKLFTAIIKISYQDYDSKISCKSFGLIKIMKMIKLKAKQMISVWQVRNFRLHSIHTLSDTWKTAHMFHCRKHNLLTILTGISLYFWSICKLHNVTMWIGWSKT